MSFILLFYSSPSPLPDGANNSVCVTNFIIILTSILSLNWIQNLQIFKTYLSLGKSRQLEKCRVLGNSRSFEKSEVVGNFWSLGASWVVKNFLKSVPRIFSQFSSQISGYSTPLNKVNLFFDLKTRQSFGNV